MVGCYIHNTLHFPTQTRVLNVQNQCASFVDGCETAWNFILAGRYKRILVVMVAALNTSGGAGRADVTDPVFAVAGDGAGAAIVSSQNLKCEFLGYHNCTFGEIYDMCAAESRSPAHPDLKGAPEQPPIATYTFGTPEFFAWWQQVGERFAIDGIEGALKEANLSVSDIDTIIFHQPADMLYDVWMDGAEKAGISKNKWKHTWHKYGNVGCAVIPVNLAEFWEAGELKKNSIMAWVTIGAGGHAPSMIVKWLV
jgi:3-oxoacyl-[acyl-carrier-protein] synthase-3